MGRLLAKEALRLPAQKGGITGMFGGSKLCHCEIGTDRIRNKPLMEKGYKLPLFGDHGNLAGSGGEEPKFTSD